MNNQELTAIDAIYLNLRGPNPAPLGRGGVAYDEMTILDLIATAFEKVNAGDEHGPLITELASRLSRAQVYRENLTCVVDPYLREADGSDLIPDHTRIANMLERLSVNSEICPSVGADNHNP